MEDMKHKVRDFIANRKRMLNEMTDDDKKAMDDAEPPSMEKIMKVINSLGSVSEEDKEKLRKRILERSADGVGGFSPDFLRGKGDALKGTKENLISASSDYEYYLFMFMITLVLLVFGKKYLLSLCKYINGYRILLNVE